MEFCRASASRGLGADVDRVALAGFDRWRSALGGANIINRGEPTHVFYQAVKSGGWSASKAGRLLKQYRKRVSPHPLFGYKLKRNEVEIPSCVGKKRDTR